MSPASLPRMAARTVPTCSQSAGWTRPTPLAATNAASQIRPPVTTALDTVYERHDPHAQRQTPHDRSERDPPPSRRRQQEDRAHHRRHDELLLHAGRQTEERVTPHDSLARTAPAPHRREHHQHTRPSATPRRPCPAARRTAARQAPARRRPTVPPTTPHAADRRPAERDRKPPPASPADRAPTATGPPPAPPRPGAAGPGHRPGRQRREAVVERGVDQDQGIVPAERAVELTGTGYQLPRHRQHQRRLSTDRVLLTEAE